ncbi:MAG: hypothetical protein A3K19_31560 [Lentisphaerae bacterium RIFOXYB12_FULL_65_16]|nr:MAG: hypothetical protein A3K18_03905 [Lentisphaerae bacterium RIFOXYA12_64_32]OGV88641.1 MAG: hypothetical protein A3K19_31560 [Lentisphaerae bacterium RIFOXYB12_FULL_65_16]
MDRCLTRERILDAAERLFAEQGFAAASMRAITHEAGVNLAAVNYHFVTKEKLLIEVVRRRVVPINRERLERLDRLETEARGRPVPVEAVLTAFVAPVFALRTGEPGGGHFPRLLGRLYGEPAESLTRFYEEEFGEMMRRFAATLQRSIPGLEPSGVFWGLTLATGMLCHILMAGDRLGLCTAGVCRADDAEEITQHVVRFAVAGLTSSAASARQEVSKTRGRRATTSPGRAPRIRKRTGR